MNFSMIRFLIGIVMVLEGVMMLIPAGIAAYNKDDSQIAFFAVMAILLVSGILLSLKKPKSKLMYAPEGFLTVTLSWLVMSFFGALPFYISGEIPSFTNAFFESVSGFTATGATILTDVEALSAGMQFWRAFTQWIGGLGILMFMMAIVPLAGGRSIFLLRAEFSGTRVDKIVPRMRHSALILYVIYFSLSLLQVIFLLFGGMSLFDSVIHTFSTAGTGGLSNRTAGISYYNSQYIETVITVFMILFGINFNIFFLLILRKFKNAVKNEELRYYIGLILTASVLIGVNIYSQYGSLGDTLRVSTFQAASIISSTAFTTANISSWPEFSKGIILILMFVGSCAGSTGGGMKISRIILLFKSAAREMKSQLHPRSVNSIRFNGKQLDEVIPRTILVYFAVYFLIIIFSALILSLDVYGFEESLTTSVSCMSNIGLIFSTDSITSCFEGFSPLSKAVICFEMFCGRLEIFPMLVLFFPSTWRGKIKSISL